MSTVRDYRLIFLDSFVTATTSMTSVEPQGGKGG